MNELTPVFEISLGTNGIRTDAVFRLAIGVIILTAGILGLILRKRTGGRFPKKLYGPAFMTGWGILWLLIHIPFWRIGTAEIDNLLSVYHNGKSPTTEGIVHVSHEQPATGHTAGDKITVGDQTFEVNYFLVTPGYKQTISHGGALREGVFARLHYYHGVILKVEVGNKKASQQQVRPRSFHSPRFKSSSLKVPARAQTALSPAASQKGGIASPAAARAGLGPP